MRLILKILAAPIVVALTLFVWICSGLLYVSAFVFGLAGTVVAILGVAVLVTYSPKNGIILLIIAFLVSPMGLPMAAAWLLGKMQDLRYAIQDRVYGEQNHRGSVGDVPTLLFFLEGRFHRGDDAPHAPAHRQGPDGGDGHLRHPRLCGEPAKD